MNLQNKICLVTGANSGVGYGTACSLASQGAHLVMVCRNEERGKIAQKYIQEETGNPEVDLLIADLASQKDIRRLAQQFTATYPQLDLLINNAAIVPPKRELNEDGLEMQFAVNTFAPFLLSSLLLEALQASPDGRLVNLSALMSTWLKARLEDIQSEDHYNLRGWRAYHHTKIWLSLVTLGFVARLEGSSVRVVGVHPGVVSTNILKVGGVLRWIWNTIGLTPEQSGEHIARISTLSELKHGYYYDTHGKSVHMGDYYSPEIVEHVWQTCEALVKKDEH